MCYTAYYEHIYSNRTCVHSKFDACGLFVPLKHWTSLSALRIRHRQIFTSELRHNKRRQMYMSRRPQFTL